MIESQIIGDDFLWIIEISIVLILKIGIHFYELEKFLMDIAISKRFTYPDLTNTYYLIKISKNNK